MPKGSKPQKAQPRTAFQMLQQQLKWVDIVFEVLDARAPMSSRHPEHLQIFGNKPRLVFLTKDDLADGKVCREFVKRLTKSENERALLLSLKTRTRQPEVVAMALELSAEKIKQIEAKGLLPRPVRICVVGMPNTGKSSLINWLVGKKQVKVADRPGVTRGPQWIRVHPKLELLDTPGILPPNISNRNIGEKLGIFNLAPPGAYSPEELADRAILELETRYPGALRKYLPDAEAPKPVPVKVVDPEDEEADGGRHWLLERDLATVAGMEPPEVNLKTGTLEDFDENQEDENPSEEHSDDHDEVENLKALQSNSQKNILLPEKIDLTLLAERKHFLTAKGRPDTARAAAILLSDIRAGRLGRITFDSPDPK